MLLKVVSNARDLYSKAENPDLAAEDRKETFGDKRNLVDPFPGKENRYEIQVWAYPEIQAKNWYKNAVYDKI